MSSSPYLDYSYPLPGYLPPHSHPDSSLLDEDAKYSFPPQSHPQLLSTASGVAPFNATFEDSSPFPAVSPGVFTPLAASYPGALMDYPAVPSSSHSHAPIYSGHFMPSKADLSIDQSVKVEPSDPLEDFTASSHSSQSVTNSNSNSVPSLSPVHPMLDGDYSASSSEPTAMDSADCFDPLDCTNLSHSSHSIASFGDQPPAIFRVDPKKTKENARKRKLRVAQLNQTNGINSVSGSDIADPAPVVKLEPLEEGETDGPLALILKEIEKRTNNERSNAEAKAAMAQAPAALDSAQLPKLDLDDLDACGLAPDAAEYKRLQRLQRNRASAQLSRERKKQYVKDLEVQMAAVQSENERLNERVKTLEQENEKMRSAMAAFVEREKKLLTAAFGPDPKRRRVSNIQPQTPAASQRSTAYSNAHSSAHSRTKLMMIGLVFSFALFSTLVGLDFLHSPVNYPAASVGSPDFLQLSASVAPLSPASLPLPITALSPASRILQSIESSDGDSSQSAKALIDPAVTVSPSDHSRALIPVSADSMAVDIYSSVSAPKLAKPISNWGAFDPNTRYRRENTGMCEEKGFNRSDSSCRDASSSSATAKPSDSDVYMFIPSMVQIRPQFEASAASDHTHSHNQSVIDVSPDLAKETAVSKRLRRALRLPAPEAEVKEFEAGEEKLQLGKDSNIMLWLPVNSLHSSAQATENENSSVPLAGEADKATGMLEMACKIVHIRPVMKA